MTQRDISAGYAEHLGIDLGTLQTLAKELRSAWEKEVEEARKSVDLSAPAPFVLIAKNGAPFPAHEREAWRRLVDGTGGGDVDEAEQASYGDTIDYLATGMGDAEFVSAAALIILAFNALFPGVTPTEDTLSRIATVWPHFHRAKADSNAYLLHQIRNRSERPTALPHASVTLDQFEKILRAQDKVEAFEGLQRALDNLQREQAFSTPVAEDLKSLSEAQTRSQQVEQTDYRDRALALSGFAWIQWATPSVERALAFVEMVASNKMHHHLAAVIAPAVFEREEVPGEDRDSDTLARELQKSTVGLMKALRALGGSPEPSAMDAVLVTHLHGIGEKRGEALARDIAKAAEERAHDKSQALRQWQHEPEGERFLINIGRALWAEYIAERVERSKNRRPGVVRQVWASRLLPAMSRQMELPGTDDEAIRDSKGKVIAEIALTTGATTEAVRNGLFGLGTVAGNRLIRALILLSHDSWNMGEQDYRRVAFEGGWQAVAKAIGVHPKDISTLQSIAMAGQCVEWNTPYIKNNGLWTFSERRGSRLGPGEVAFVLGDAMAPGYAHRLARAKGADRSLSARMARRLIPELRHEPPVSGARNRDHGAVWTLHRLFMQELVDGAEDLHRHGHIVLTPHKWASMAGMARLPQASLNEVLKAWAKGDSKHVPALIDRDGDAYTLADPHSLERDFIKASGAKRARGRSRATKKRT